MLAARLQIQADQLFAIAGQAAGRGALPIQVLDVELLFDGSCAIFHIVGPADCDWSPLSAALEADAGLTVRFENLAAGAPHEEHEEHEEHAGGCGKPDCGRGEGGCSSCGSGGCGSCGKDPVDLRPYFAHLRAKMEAEGRTSLL